VSIKDVRSQEGGEVEVYSADILWTRRGFTLQMRTSAFFGAKTLDFSKFIVCPHGQEGSELGRSRGKGSIFRDFFANVFYGQSLS